MYHAIRCTLSSAALVAVSLLAIACGGGGGGEDEEQDDSTLVTTPIGSSPELDGHVAYNNQGDVATLGEKGIPQVGDGANSGGSAAATVHEGIWSFDLGAVPPGTTIGAATLHLVISSSVNDPDGMMGLGRLDHVRYGSDFPAARALIDVLAFNFTTVNDMTSTGERLLDVTAAVQDDLDAGRGRSQFRLRGAIGTDNDDLAEVAIMTSGDTANPALRPTLVVQYRSP